MTDLAATAREIIDGSLYMVLGTADEAGSPWVSPVYFAVSDYTDFYWVSLPDAQHSRNLAARPEVSIVVFDSGVPIGTGQGVYMAARARSTEESPGTPRMCKPLRPIASFARPRRSTGRSIRPRSPGTTERRLLRRSRKMRKIGGKFLATAALVSLTSR